MILAERNSVAMELKNPMGPFVQAQQGLTAVAKPAIYGVWKANEIFEVGDVRRVQTTTLQTITFSENKVTSLVHCTFLDGTQGSVYALVFDLYLSCFFYSFL